MCVCCESALEHKVFCTLWKVLKQLFFSRVLHIQARLPLNSWQSCLVVFGARITGVLNNVCLIPSSGPGFGTDFALSLCVAVISSQGKAHNEICSVYTGKPT